MARPTLRRNGKTMVTLRMTQHLSRRDAAAILAMEADAHSEALPVSWAKLDGLLRDHLAQFGWERIHWVGDYVEESQVEDAEDHLETVFGWED